MFGQRKPYFVNSENAIKSEVQDVKSTRDHKRLTIDQMVQDIEEALAYIGYVDTYFQQNNNNGQANQGNTSSYSDEVEIL